VALEGGVDGADCVRLDACRLVICDYISKFDQGTVNRYIRL